MKKLVLSCAFFMLIISQSFAQFTLTGEFRPRFENRGGYAKLLSENEKPIFFVSQRTRLSAYYQTGIYTFGFGIQDVMVWGDDDIYTTTGVFGNKASIDINEAWFGIKPYKKGNVKIGRQYWAYEDERLISSRSWNQSQIKYDGILLQHSEPMLKVDAGLSWNNDIDRNFGNEYPTGKMKSLDFVYIRKDINDWLHVTVMALATGFTASDSTSDINWQGTYVAYLGAKKGPLNVLASGFYQNGKNRKGLTTSAYMFSLSGDYLIHEKYSAGAGIDYLSGHDQSSQDSIYLEKAHAFDNFYGTRHGFFGHMDLFNNLPKSTGNGGLIDLFVRLKWSPVASTKIGADFHIFSLQNNVRDMTSEEIAFLTKGLGQEVDLNVSWDITKVFNIKGGYSMYFSSDSMDKLQGIYGNARFPYWIWIMITAKPVFLDTAQK